MTQLRAQVNALPRRAREQLLQDLLRDTAPIDLSPLYPLIVPRLQRDFLRTLPLELALHVLSFVDDARTLARASAVSRHWHALLLDESTWRRMCWKSGFAPPEQLAPAPPVSVPPAHVHTQDDLALVNPNRFGAGSAARLRTLEFGERTRDRDDALFTPAGRERRGTLDRSALEEIASRTGGYGHGFPLFGSVFGGTADSAAAVSASTSAAGGDARDAMDVDAAGAADLATTTGLGFGVSAVEAEGAARASMAARRARGSVEALSTGLTSPGLVPNAGNTLAMEVDSAVASPVMPDAIQFGTIPPGPVRTPTSTRVLRRDEDDALFDRSPSPPRSAPPPVASTSSTPALAQPFSYRSHFKLAYLSEQNWVRGPGTLLSTQMSVDQGVVTSMAFDNEWIVVGMDTSKVHIFEAGMGTYVRTLTGHELGVWCLTLVSKGGGPRHDDDAGADDADDQWDAPLDTTDDAGGTTGKGKQRARSREPGAPAHSAFFRPDATPLAASSYSSPSSPAAAAPPPRRRRRSFGSLEPASAGSGSAARGGWSGARPSTCGGMGLGAGGPTGDSTQQGGVCGTARGWGQEGAVVVSGGSDRNVRVWDVATGCVLLATYLRVSCSSDWTTFERCRPSAAQLTLEPPVCSRCLHVLPGHTSTVRCLRVLDARPIAVSGSRDGSIRVWDIERGLALRLLSGHRKSVRAIEVCGNRIVSGSYDTTARVSHGSRAHVVMKRTRRLGRAELFAHPWLPFAALGRRYGRMPARLPRPHWRDLLGRVRRRTRHHRLARLDGPRLGRRDRVRLSLSPTPSSVAYTPRSRPVQRLPRAPPGPHTPSRPDAARPLLGPARHGRVGRHRHGLLARDVRAAASHQGPLAERHEPPVRRALHPLRGQRRAAQAVGCVFTLLHLPL